MSEAGKKRPGWPLRALWVLLLAIPAALLAVVVLIYSLLFWAWSRILCLAIWIRWKRRRALFVYSDSPIWKDYLEDEIFPRIADRLVLLNWSERKTWKRSSLAVLAFSHFGAVHHFNPLAIVFHPYRRVQRFPFYAAFKDFKHGDSRELARMKKNLFAALGV